ncbi:hypothetical protein SDC9_61094 [bioreactor metagenome]|uniref:Uncharacterized protein n=1 Tax=bioreactor metagenome TaxID=1076179 RepID=A0A644XES3_9ZZZZ
MESELLVSITELVILNINRPELQRVQFRPAVILEDHGKTYQVFKFYRSQIAQAVIK